MRQIALERLPLVDAHAFPAKKFGAKFTHRCFPAGRRGATIEGWGKINFANYPHQDICCYI
jgi:hypothetical protein